MGTLKFDAQRVLEDAGRFAFPRMAGTEGERRAVDLVADALKDTGWSVEQSRTPTPPRFYGVSCHLLASGPSGTFRHESSC